MEEKIMDDSVAHSCNDSKSKPRTAEKKRTEAGKRLKEVKKICDGNVEEEEREKKVEEKIMDDSVAHCCNDSKSKPRTAGKKRTEGKRLLKEEMNINNTTTGSGNNSELRSTSVRLPSAVRSRYNTRRTNTMQIADGLKQPSSTRGNFTDETLVEDSTRALSKSGARRLSPYRDKTLAGDRTSSSLSSKTSRRKSASAKKSLPQKTIAEIVKKLSKRLTSSRKTLSLKTSGDDEGRVRRTRTSCKGRFTSSSKGDNKQKVSGNRRARQSKKVHALPTDDSRTLADASGRKRARLRKASFDTDAVGSDNVEKFGGDEDIGCIADSELPRDRDTKPPGSDDLVLSFFQCTCCVLKFYKEENLAKHKQMSHSGGGDGEVEGRTVRQSRVKENQSDLFENAERTSASRKEVTRTKKVRACHDCDLVFQTRHLLKKHQRYAHATSNKVKEECSNERSQQTMEVDDSLGSHSDHREAVSKKCFECGEEFKTDYELCTHLTTAHKVSREAASSKTTKNLTANKNRTSKARARKPRRPRSDAVVRSSDLKENLKCSECDRTFSVEVELCKHQLKTHNIKTFTCKFCPKAFSRKASLQNHQLIHLKVVTTDSTTDGGTRKRMVLFEERSADELLRCLRCSCVFRNWKNYKKHLASDHPDVESHLCNVCCRVFDSQKELMTHMSRHKEIYVPELDLDSLLECPLCNSLFLTLSKLKAHKVSKAKFKK